VEVRVVDAAGAEFDAMGEREQAAMLNAIAKLEALGDRRPFPHASNVRGAGNLWELRPRAGRSPWRAFYRRIGGAVVISAFGHEAQVDPAGFARAAAAAAERLDAEERRAAEGRR
jgi:hypothetical protein